MNRTDWIIEAPLLVLFGLAIATLMALQFVCEGALDLLDGHLGFSRVKR